MGAPSSDAPDTLLATTLFFGLWPALDFLVLAVLQGQGYAQTTGGGLLQVLFGALSLVAGAACLLVLGLRLRRPHAPWRLGRPLSYALGALLLSSALNIAFVILPMSCRVGDCPAWN